MNEFIDAALLGLGAGAIYALLAHGLVVVYRGSGLLNFSQGAFAMAGAYLFYALHVQRGWPVSVSIIVVVLACAAAGVLFQLLVMQPMRRSAPLARVVATLGLLITLESLVNLKYGAVTLLVNQYLPSGIYQPFDHVRIGQAQVVLLGIAFVITIVLWAVYRFTNFGRATQMVAEDQRVAAALGHSPNRIGAVNWAIGCGLAGLAGCLFAPITGLQISTLTLLVIPAIAAAAVGGFASFPLAFVSGVGIGIAESLMSRYVTQPGWDQAVPFLLIVGLIVIRGRGIPLRDFALQRLPAVAAPTFPRTALVAPLVILLVSAQLLSPGYSLALTNSAIVVIEGISVVILTGYTGQLSLAAYTMAGIGGLAAARASSAWGWSIVPSFVLGSAVAIAAGMMVAVPALRTRGINLAVVTMGLAVVVQAVVFNSPAFAGSISGVTIPTPSLFGWDVDITSHMDRYASMVYVVLIGVVLLAMNIRRGGVGRRMLAVRGNERAAASLGVGVRSVKLYAFAVSAFVASAGGILMTFQTTTAEFATAYDVLPSLLLVGLVVLGSVGYLTGPVIAAGFTVSGIVSFVIDSHFSSFDEYLALIGGVLIMVQLVQYQDGISAGIVAAWRKIRGASRRPDTQSVPPADAVPDHTERVERVAARVLTVSDLRVQFANVVAVAGVSFSVAPGEIVGLIGPNGAGKTTVIDGITGFVKSSGAVALGERTLGRKHPHVRANAGLARSFQSIELFDDLTVAENLAVATDGTGLDRSLLDLVRPRPVTFTDTALAAVNHFALGQVLDRKPPELSFAQRRLVGIARVVAKAPSILLLDEAAAGLDRVEIEELSSLLRTLADDWGMGILLIEHHLDMVVSTCDRIVVLDQGRVLFAGTPEHALKDVGVRGAYIGEVV